MIDTFLACMKEKGWSIELHETKGNHLPIFLSVKDGYTYYAISMKDGSIVQGAEPEFEECKMVAVSFADFLEKFITDKL